MRCVFWKKTDIVLALSLVFAVFLWGGNNCATKLIITTWPPAWIGSTRFLGAGAILLVLLRWSGWFGPYRPLPPGLGRELWWRGGLSLAAYLVVFNWALRLTAVSHVALYLGASPVWALAWEGRPENVFRALPRYGAALLALAGVFVLFVPALNSARAHWVGEILGLLASLLWTLYGRQCRHFRSRLSGVEISAHTMAYAGLTLLPLACLEILRSGLVWRADVVLVQVYCVLAGGVTAYCIWNHALSRWPASQVLLFNNLIPLSTMTWAWFWLREPVTPTFWLAMVLIVLGVLLGQAKWQQWIAPVSVSAE